MGKKLKKFRVYANVVGGKFLGEFEAASAEAAIDLAAEGDHDTDLCHHCAGKIDEPTVDMETATAEESP